MLELVKPVRKRVRVRIIHLVVTVSIGLKATVYTAAVAKSCSAVIHLGFKLSVVISKPASFIRYGFPTCFNLKQPWLQCRTFYQKFSFLSPFT